MLPGAGKKPLEIEAWINLCLQATAGMEVPLGRAG